MPSYDLDVFVGFMFIDLERQISLRTTREDLIKRGVLKEVDDNARAGNEDGGVELGDIAEDGTGT